MSFKLTNFTYPSRDGIHNICAHVYEPTSCEARGIVEICHGMVDHIGRYINLVEYLTERGFIVAGNDHLGHGGSVMQPDDYGHFSDKGGLDYVIGDLHTMNRQLRTRYRGLPIIMLGHSMGSFIARIYATRYPHSIRGLIIHGTSGPNPLVPFGRMLAGINRAFYGARHRSRFIKNLAFSGYNSKFPKEEGENAWLTRELAQVSDRPNDPRTNFTFTVTAYRELFSMLGESNSREWYKKYPKALPTLIMSGDMDPVGAYGKGPMTVYKKLLISGASSVSLKLYEGARHELFNESNREEVFCDIVSWIAESIK